MKKIFCLLLVVGMLLSGNIAEVCAGGVIMYSLDGRTCVVNESEVYAYKMVGWYNGKPVTMYSDDGRAIIVGEREISDYEKVGWHYKVTMYAPDGRTAEVPYADVQAWKNVGWYTEPVVVMYSLDGRTVTIAESEIEAYKAVGWYTEEMYNAYYFYPTDVISEKVPRFDIAVGGTLYNEEAPSDSKSSPDYWYRADFEKARAYQNLLKNSGWEQDGLTDFNYETKIVNNTVKKSARSFSVFFVKGKVKLHFYYSYKTGNVCVSYYNRY